MNKRIQVAKMNQKENSQPVPVHAQNIGFHQAPPAYDQHQYFPQGQPHQQQIYPTTNQPQVITGNINKFRQGFYSSTNITVITGNGFGPDPIGISCPSCHAPIVTRVDYESSTKTHLMAGLICLLFWPCFCLPYMMDACKNANHYCPHCGTYLGTYRGS